MRSKWPACASSGAIAQPGEARCVIGSVKSNIGHLLTAAGGAALTKVLLAMRAGNAPPHRQLQYPATGHGP